MEDSAKLRLQWHDHGNELSRLSREIFGNDDLTDVTLTCRGGTPFHAHKIILAAASTYFKSFFREVQGKINQHPVIFMKDVEPSEMKYLLQFIYRGEVDIPSEELERLIEIAKDLGIVGLDAVNTDNGEQKSERRTLKGTKRKSTASPVASTSKQPKVKNEHDDPLGDEDFGDFIDDDGADDDDDDDGDDDLKEHVSQNVGRSEERNLKLQTTPKSEEQTPKELMIEARFAEVIEGRRKNSIHYIIEDYHYLSERLRHNKNDKKILTVRCVHYKRKKCCGTAQLENNNLRIIKISGEHSCDQWMDPDDKIQIQMESKMKDLAMTAEDSLRKIYDNVCLENPAVAVRIPYSRMEAVMRVRRNRAKPKI